MRSISPLHVGGVQQLTTQPEDLVAEGTSGRKTSKTGPAALAQLPTVFRQKAAMLRSDGGADQPAVAWERAAEIIECALVGHLDESLSLEDAATESNYTVGHLRRLNREGKMPIEPDGTVLRRYLPKKPGARVASNLTEAPSSRVQLARAVADGG